MPTMKTNFKMPVLFFTQLMGVAFGENVENLGFGSEFVSARQAIEPYWRDYT